MIVLRDAVSGYGRARILNGVSLSVGAAEIVTVIGPNGAGKTTLVSTIAGLRPLWEGSLSLGPDDLTKLPAEDRARRGVVMCPEGRRILATLTVEENLRLGALPALGDHDRRGAREFVAAQLESAYQRFPILRERRGAKGGALSGGQQQMLAIARSLMSKPGVLILDEPSLGLAPKVIGDVYQELVSLRDEGLALILVEEAATRALAVADRAIVMRNGSVVIEGSAAELAADDVLQDAYLGTVTQ